MVNSLNSVDSTAETAARDEGLGGAVGNVAQSCPKMTLEIGVFFDGTLNNRYNVMSRARSDDSYQNGLSNPALLYDIYKSGPAYRERNACGGPAKEFRSIYVEGIGSTRGQEDSFTGYAFGQGETGVEARVLEGFRRTLRMLAGLGGSQRVEKVVIDTFGFSRGAAAARYFVNCIRARRCEYDPVGWGDYEEEWPDDVDVEIRFVGIFDTVAAIGRAANEDNGPVNVYVKTAQADRIHHITAGNEFRENFRLNRNTPGGGTTQELPGAHSDVGGGYRGTGDEAPLGRSRQRSFSTRARAEAEQRATRAADNAPGANARAERVWVREGWMRSNETGGGIRRVLSPIQEQLIPTRYGMTRRHNYTEHLMLDRPWVQPGLNTVALHIMHEIALSEQAGLLALPTGDDKYDIPAGLQPFVSEMKNQRVSAASRREILRNYGHVSAKSGNIGDWIAHSPEPTRIRVEYDNRPGEAI